MSGTETGVRLFKLNPKLVARPWGRPSLAPLYPQPLPDGSRIGEAWLTSVDCFVSGPGAAPEETLGAIWARLTPAEQGARLAEQSRFPLLVKFLFTAEKLSVQVHPDDDYARRHEGEPWGKTEMWYVVDAAADAWVGLGVKPTLSREQLEAALAPPSAGLGGSGVEEALERIPLRAGDALFVPAGTLHAIGPGACLCEIQQYSDVTYRVYDYDRPGLDGRPRALHHEQARAVTRLKTPEAGRVTPQPIAGTPAGWRLVRCPYFTVESYRLQERGSLSVDPGRFQLLVVCAGAGQLSVGSESLSYAAGEAFLVPAATGTVEIEPTEPTELLRVFPGAPDD